MLIWEFFMQHHQQVKCLSFHILAHNLRIYQLWSDGNLACSADIQIMDIWVSVC